MRSRLLSAVLVLALAAALAASEPARPDVVVVLVDDMGFSDVGCYGGEIATPNIDRLAAEGVRFRTAYNTARCCPTRASLLTGAWPHQAGMGWMTAADSGRPAYRGDLRRDLPTIAEVLAPLGYARGIFGKWHVADDRFFRAETRDTAAWPLGRGFETWVGANAGGNHWRDRWIEDEREVKVAETVYYGDLITERAEAWIRGQPQDRPLFAYVAYTNPHFPLHAKAEDIAAQGGRYAEGWDAVRAARFARQRELGVLPAHARLARDEAVGAWTDQPAAEQADLALRMRIYAAQVAHIDAGIGRLRAALEATGRLDRTVFVFLSDNGGTMEDTRPEHIPADKVGRSAGMYRRPWAHVSNTPFRGYKMIAHEGGARTPLIVRWPGAVAQAGGWTDQVAHVVDLLPTIAAAAGAQVEPRDDGAWPAGIDLRPAIAGAAPAPRTIFLEHEGNRAVREGDLKLVAEADRPWELYDLAADPTETDDLAGRRPADVARLEGVWTAWATRHGVLPLDTRPWKERVEASVPLPPR